MTERCGFAISCHFYSRLGDLLDSIARYIREWPENRSLGHGNFTLRINTYGSICAQQRSVALPDSKRFDCDCLTDHCRNRLPCYRFTLISPMILIFLNINDNKVFENSRLLSLDPRYSSSSLYHKFCVINIKRY